MADLYWKDNTHKEYGVLIAPGYGAGWSSWAGENASAYQRAIIEYWLDNKNTNIDIVKKWFEDNGYDAYVSPSNWYNLRLVWIPVDTYWRVKEYDGSEAIEFLNLNNWYRFDSNGIDSNGIDT